MITYFNLHAPESAHLRADEMEGAPTEERQILRCQASSDHLAGRRRLRDLALQVRHNKRDELIIWPWISGCLIHDRLLAEFKRHELTGYRVRDARVRFRDGVVSRDYRELQVTGWGGVARPESGIRIVKCCQACRWKKYSRLIDSESLIDWNQWTGEDFFVVWPLPNYILVTERVAGLLLNLDAKSFELRSLEGVGGDGFTVGRLSNFMPEDLAIKYGAPIGLE